MKKDKHIDSETPAPDLTYFVLICTVSIQPIDRAGIQQRQFIADASHELKTPLTVIMTNADSCKIQNMMKKAMRYFLQAFW